MSTARIVFHVQDSGARPIHGALLSATSGAGPWQGMTNVEGEFIANLTPAHYDVTVSAPGYVTRSLPADLADPGTITIGLDAAVSSIRIQGINFLDAVGQRQVFCGTDAFCAFRMFLDGGPQALEPLFSESNDLGFDLWRVFFMGSQAQNGVLDLNPRDPGVYDQVRPFADLVNSKGLTLLATVNVDAQDKCPTVTEQRENWTEMARRLTGSNTLISLGNEWRKNGFDPGNFSDPGMPWSRGSDLSDSAPYTPYATFAEFHPRRDMPASVMDTVASPVFIYGTGGLTHPLIIDEPPKFGTNGSGPEFADPFTAYRFARHYATECGGAVFHNWFGQRGQLMDGQTRVCAESWVRGMVL